MTAWMRLDAGTMWDTRVGSLSSDEMRWAYIEAMCFAKLQSPEGVFRSSEQYMAVTRRSSAVLEELVGVGLAERHPSGSVWIADWEALQMPRDRTGAKRQQEWRRRQVEMREALRNSVTNALPDQTNLTAKQSVRDPDDNDSNRIPIPQESLARSTPMADGTSNDN